MIIKKHSKIKHLDDDSLSELYRRYLKGEKIQQLIDDYQIDCATNDFINILPPEKLDETCPTCGEQLYRLRVSRNYLYLIMAAPVLCYQCEETA